MEHLRFFGLCLLAMLASCSSAPPTGLTGIQVLAQVGANQSSATALDLVFVYDTTSASLLPKSGPEWFDKKAALVAGLATALDVVSLQIPPATTVSLPTDPAFPARYKKAVAVYSYANYLSVNGQPVGNLTPYKSVQIVLTPDNVQYSGQMGSK